MRVFVTGATGFIGSAVVRELVGAGHEVVGLARSDEAAATLANGGVDVHRGDLDDLESLRDGAAGADGVVHMAYRHDLFASGDLTGAGAVDLRAIEAIGAALDGTGKPVVVPSGTLAVPPGKPATEDDLLDPGSHRRPAEDAATALAGRGVRSSVVRLPPTVHGRGDRGFVPALIGVARDRGVAGYAGDGANRWPAVHLLDAARLVRLALEDAPAGARLHAVADEGVPLRDIAGVIGRHLGVPVVGVPGAEAEAHFGIMSRFVSLDGPASSEHTRKLLGWRPTEPGLVPDLDEGHYFTS
ncbi:SDR family oxidoreductase [Actinomadura syzygii]|uniref:SDR family oxidoreductase n=1 Tax=Actinomadura syzygii TaxID=1427538 RepID=A0A5D0ULU2_9ACTN|nr:SDR family oxidoreductase [Actinomadura syzygii]TYC18800.1 SDR family oxidoreductase [Actinomadura syzygii]